MKIKILLYAFLIAISIQPFTGKAQAVNTQDSLALVDLYNSTNGTGWTNHTNWLTAAPLSSWYGVQVFSGRVGLLQVDNNNLQGTIPSSLGNLTQTFVVELGNNKLSGNIPASIGNLILGGVYLDHNQLTTSSVSLSMFQSLSDIHINDNQFNFDVLEPLVLSNTHNARPIYSPQADIPLQQNGNVLSVSAGGTLSKNTYQWYNDDVLVATKTGDPTFTISAAGNYSVTVSNSTATDCILYSISTASIQDSLALVDLYNSTNGASWTKNTNWLTTAPVSTWYGVTVRRGKVISLALPGNNLTGTIPASLGNLSNLSTLDLGNYSLINNHLSGTIPVSIGNLSNLTSMVLANNQLTGDVPVSIGNLSNLSNIDLGKNQLSGSIPASVGNLSVLRTLSLYGNQLTGDIPPSLGNLSNLIGMALYENQLSGSIPASFGKLSKLQTLYLNSNQLTGNIPDSLYNATVLSQISLNDNHLTGSISDSIIKLPKLARIHFENNQLTGKIPDSLGRPNELFDVCLNNNQLSGPISFTLRNSLTILATFRIENNKFTFDGMETLPVAHEFPTSYSPQATIPLSRNGNLLSVSAGGTLANDTFRLFKDGVVAKSQVGDSSFVLDGPGKYYVTVTNKIATQLTLTSAIDTIPALVLTPVNTTATYNITGTDSTNIQDLPYHNLMLTVIPGAGANALNGSVDFKVTIDPSVQVFNNQPYVQRHYDIVPATNPTTSTAIVKLYFTQTDFDNFNAAPAHGLDLPNGPADATGIANLRVYQYHGFSTTSLPGTYSGNAVEINPDDANITWNADAQYWVVSFDVNGFSGFFVSSLNNALLPIKLLSFSGQVKGSIAMLQWVSEKEINTSYFEVQRGTDGKSFNMVGKVNASGNSSNNISYFYSDPLGSSPVYYYRLKMLGRDGNFTYSNIIKLSVEAAVGFKVYPNPVRDFVIIELPVTTRDTKIKLMDMNGRIIQMSIAPRAVSQIKLNTKGLASGVYKIICDDGVKINVRTLLIE